MYFTATTVFTKMGKKTTKAVINIFDTIPKPNQIRKRGARASLGVV
jgi:hypothetical protein